MFDDYDWEADALGSYNHAMKAIGDAVKSGAPIPSCLLGDGEHTERLLEEREQTHGDFADNARIAQRLRHLFRAQPGWEKLPDMQRESLDMIACKVGRILSGNAFEPDHWADISGYAELGQRCAHD